MPAEYRIYRHAKHPDGEALVHISSMVGNSAEQVLRAHLKLAPSIAADGDTYSVIPDTHVHELKPTVEMQPRLSFS